MSTPAPGSEEWLAQVEEPIVDPKREIVDPHHHLWRENYGLDQLLADTRSGHAVTKTVFVECRSAYHEDGPEHLKPVGETEFVAEVAAQSAKTEGPTICGIVAHADLTRGEAAAEVLEAHEQAGQGLFRGIRHWGAHIEDPAGLMIPGGAPKGLYERDDFRQGLQLLGRRGLTFDAWHYHFQNADFAGLARAVPETTMVLDHFGTPLGVASFAGKRDEIFAQWKKDITELASCDNVVAKLGGLAMPDNGFGWHMRSRPATSDELVAAQAPYYLHTIECFGPERCMMESNFPVDRMSISYPVLFNGLKKIVADFSEDEKEAMFSRTATRVYRL